MSSEQEILKDLEQFEHYTGPDRMVTSHQWVELNKNKPKIESIKTGLGALDEMIGGFFPGDIVVVSAPTGNGKTLFCQTLTNLLSKQAVSCAWFSYEVVMERFMERFPEVPFFSLPLEIKNSSVEWVIQRVKESVVKYDTKVVFIDHLNYLISFEQMMDSNSISLYIGQVMRTLKKLALEYKITIVLVSHIKKINMDSAPQLDDIRDSSFIGQEADTVLMLWRVHERDERQKAVWNATNKTILFLKKNRYNGRLGNIKLIYKEPFLIAEQDFYDAATKTDPAHIQ